MSECAVKDYMREITDIDTLTISEERKLFELIKDGDEDARQKMITSNLRLVAKIAHDFKGMGLPLEDLISVGNIGLMKAVDKYELGKGTKFSTYAALWIKQSMRRELDYSGRTISFCCNTLNRIRKIKEMKNEMGDNFNIEEVAKEIGSSKGYVATWATGYSQISLNELVSDDNNHEYGDIIPDNKNVIKSIENNEMMVLIEEHYKDILTPQEQKVIEYRYGLNESKESYTQKETAKLMDYTYQRIQQIEKTALMKLRIFLKKN